jgi:hypothetical protein
MSVKNSNDTIGNRTRDPPACSAVRQPTAPPRALQIYIHNCINLYRIQRVCVCVWGWGNFGG